MPTIFDTDIYLHERIMPGQAGDGMSEPEYTALRADVSTLLARPSIQHLTDIPDVDSGQVEGDTIVWDATAERWTPGQIAGNVARVDDHTQAMVETSVSHMTFEAGLTAVRAGANWIAARVRFAGSGSANSVSRSDHWHRLPWIGRFEYAPGGYMSGGTRGLQSQNVTLPSGVECRVTARLNAQLRGGDPGPCYYRITLTIGSQVYATPVGTNGYWCVQGVPKTEYVMFSRSLTGTGASIPVVAQVSYYDGGGFFTDAGDLEIHIEYDR